MLNINELQVDVVDVSIGIMIPIIGFFVRWAGQRLYLAARLGLAGKVFPTSAEGGGKSPPCTCGPPSMR